MHSTASESQVSNNLGEWAWVKDTGERCPRRLRGSLCCALAGSVRQECGPRDLPGTMATSWRAEGGGLGAFTGGSALTVSLWAGLPAQEFGEGTSKAEIVPIWLLNQMFLEHTRK